MPRHKLLPQLDFKAAGDGAVYDTPWLQPVYRNEVVNIHGNLSPLVNMPVAYVVTEEGHVVPRSGEPAGWRV